MTYQQNSPLTSPYHHHDKTMEITGGVPLKGTIEVSGAKNAVNKLIVATLLTQDTCILQNVPNISEVDITLSLCEEVGLTYSWNKKEKTLMVQTQSITSNVISKKHSGANRVPILLIGAILSRTKKDITVPSVGGDAIGARPTHFHEQALTALGASLTINESSHSYVASAYNGLKGTHIHLPYPSVGATENTLLAATLAHGTTVIHNAAVEPEIFDLILFLQKMGAIIYTDSNRVIRIIGVKSLSGATHHIITDRLEVASYAMAALATKGHITILGAKQEHMLSFLNTFKRVGGDFTVTNTGITFFEGQNSCKNIHLETDVFPGFSTDWQQPLVCLLTQIKGVSVIHETVYENRFGYVEILNKMGAAIETFTECLGGTPCRFKEKNHVHSIVVQGITKLSSTSIVIPDLRAGFAYVMAALIAEGTSSLTNLDYLYRGYENIDKKLHSLGAQVTIRRAESGSK